MQSIAAQLQQTRTLLASVAGDLAALEARMLAGCAWNMTKEELVLHADSAREAEPLSALVARRLRHEPISYILGAKDFWRDTFEVTSDVLTPRADSETMIETLLRHTVAPVRMVDLGTGSGCLLLSALREFPDAHGVAVDQSPKALAVAQRNAERLGLANRCSFVRSNWCQSLSGVFDVVLANPPYIPTHEIAQLDEDVCGFEPHAALDGGTDGLDCYRAILQQITPYLMPHAVMLFEVGAGQADSVALLGQRHGFTLLEITPDLAGIARIVALKHQTL